MYFHSTNKMDGWMDVYELRIPNVLSQVRAFIL